MYEDDTPAAERRVQALTPRPRPAARAARLARSCATCSTPTALTEVERDLARGHGEGPGRRARPAAPGRRPDARRAAGAARRRRRRVARRPLAERRALLLPLAGEERAIAAEDAGRYRDALGRHAARRACRPRSWTRCPTRCARSWPATPAAAARSPARRPPPATAWRVGVAESRAAGPRGRREARARQPAARARRPTSGATPTCCAGSGGPRWPRCARRSSRSTPCRAGPLRARLARRRPRHPRLARPAARRARAAAGPAAARPTCSSATCCRGASPATARTGSTRCAAAASSSGWASRAARSRCCSATTPPLLGAAGRRAAAGRRVRTPPCARRWPAGRASSATSCARPGLPQSELLAALFDLAWAGEVTNDAFAPLRSPRGRPRRGRRDPARPGDAAAGWCAAARRRPAPPRAAGRWPTTLFAGPPAERDRQRALAELLLERHGVVTRAAVQAEGVSGGFGAVYGALRDLETLGAVPPRLLRGRRRRGPVRPGRGGRAAARAARRARPARDAGAGGERSREPVRRRAAVAGAGGGPGLALRRRLRGARRRRSRRCSSSAAAAPCSPCDDDQGRVGRAVEALAAEVKRGRPARLGLERIDGEAAIGSPLEPVLRGVGFLAGPRRLTLRAPRA